MKKNLFTVLTIAVMLMASPALAFFGSKELDNAKNLYDKTDYQMAITVILDGLKESKISESDMSKAYDLLGYAYEKLGYHSEAKEAFRKALASGAVGYRDDQWILFLDVRQLEKVKELIFKAAAESPEARKSMAADIAQLARNNIASGDLDDATKLFDLAIQLERGLVNDAFAAFYNKTANNDIQTIDKYLKYARRFVSSSDKEKVFTASREEAIKRLKAGQDQNLVKAFLFFALGIKPEAKTQVQSELMKMGDSAGDYDCLSYYELAWQVNPVRTPETQKAGERLDKIGRGMLGEKTLFDQQVKASLVLANKMANGLKPYVKEYEIGKHYFDLKTAKKNESTDHIIRLPKNVSVVCKFQSSNDKFKLLFSNGRVADISKGDGAPKYINHDFVIISIEPVFVVLIINKA